ncbi:MAG: type II secretion system F family protein [Alphaproteobacteria bacterium]
MAYNSFEIWFAQKSVGTDVRLRIYKKLAGLIRNGVSLQVAMDVLWDQASQEGRKPKDPLAIAIDEWRRSYKDGHPFGQALEGWAPVSERMLIEAGESGSKLDEALDNVIKLATSSKKIKSALVGGLTYPLVLIIAIGAIMYIFGTKVIPAFGQVKDPDTWTGMGAYLAWLSHFAQNYLIFVFAGLIAFVVLFAITAPKWSGRLRSTFDKLPPWSLYRLVQGGGFLMATAALVNAGVAIPEVLRKLRKNANPWMRERIDACLREVNSGANLGEALHRTGHGFPDKEIVDDLRVYAQLSSFDESLAAVADEWIVEGVEKVDAQAKVLNTIALMLIGFTIISLVGGLFSIQQQITAG